jgi:nicotinate-nucleotide adenylyltransferase
VPSVRIAIFGGSFNPPHVAHQLACAYVLATARPRVERLWMLPTFKHPFVKRLAPFDDRVAMCERAARVFDGRVEVSRVEEELGGDSYTLRTMKALIARHPAHEFALVIGADLIAERQRWHGWAELSTLVPFLVVGRAGAAGGPELALPSVSSTDVRARLAGGRSIEGLLDVDVADYIAERGLYRDA